MYSRILVPVDGSEASLKGLGQAIELAKGTGATLRIVHVVDDLVVDMGDFVSSAVYEQIVSARREQGKQYLATAESVAKQHGVAVETELMERMGGRAADSIIDAATQYSADLIVMGTHGRRGLKRLALGSDAELVLRLTQVPVLLVRDARGK